MNQDLTRGPVMRSMLLFALPMVLGNLMQQLYNITDTLIVGKYLGETALAAVGSSFSLMTFLTSILLGLCMGSGVFFSIRFGRGDWQELRQGICTSFVLIATLALGLNLAAYLCLDGLKGFLQVPDEVWGEMRQYLAIIFAGIAATFFYNFFASLLRAVGNSVVPLVFLASSALLNILLDLWFVLRLGLGVAGAALATVAAQYLSGLGLAVFALVQYPQLRPGPDAGLHLGCLREIAGFSLLTCVQQSVMNFGILMVQGLVNSFGATVMAAFAAAVKIDAFAYMPVQDFGNAFSTFVAQNYGAGKTDRIRAALRGAVAASVGFCVVVSAAVFLFARPLMSLFADPADGAAVVAEGVRYLRIEGAFYLGIGCLFLLYGLYRALGRPGMSVVLTVISLGTRVALAYLLSALPGVGVVGIWWSIPIGWALADLVGFGYYLLFRRRLLGLPANPKE